MERERKYRLARQQAIRVSEHLTSAGRRQQAGTDRDVFFDHPLLSLERAGGKLRLRRRDRSGIAELTYKGSEGIVGRDKLRSEVTVRGSALAIERLLRDLGFTTIRTFAKRRYAYLLEGVEVSLDYISRVGWFCELEALSDDIDLDGSAATLNLHAIQIEPRSYADLVDDYRASAEACGRSPSR